MSDKTTHDQARDDREFAYQRGHEHGVRAERERAIKAGVFRHGGYVPAADLDRYRRALERLANPTVRARDAAAGLVQDEVTAIAREALGEPDV